MSTDEAMVYSNNILERVGGNMTLEAFFTIFTLPILLLAAVLAIVVWNVYLHKKVLELEDRR